MAEVDVMIKRYLAEAATQQCFAKDSQEKTCAGVFFKTFGLQLYQKRDSCEVFSGEFLKFIRTAFL